MSEADTPGDEIVPQRVVGARRDPDGLLWLPVVGWAQTPRLCTPWLIDLPGISVTGEWDFLAFIGHLTVGLHDVHEHGYDSWSRVAKTDLYEMLVSLNWVRTLAEHLEFGVADTDQFLAYRTIHTRTPWPLLQFLNDGYPNDRAAPAALPDDLDEALAARFSSDFAPPAAVERPFIVDASLSITLAAERHPTRNERVARFLDAALTFGEVPWTALFADDSESTLRFRSEGLATMRDAITDYDVSGRIGTIDGGAYSDESLRLLLRARIENLVAPAPLWAALLDGDSSALHTDGWRLPLPPAEEEPYDPETMA